MTVTILVEIAPDNDFSPKFQASHYAFSVPETSGGKNVLISLTLKCPQGNTYQVSTEWPVEQEQEYLQNRSRCRRLWASELLGNVYFLWWYSQSIILVMYQRLPWDLMSVLGFVSVVGKCTLLTFLHFSLFLPQNYDEVSASRDNVVVIHTTQISWTTGVKDLGQSQYYC